LLQDSWDGKMIQENMFFVSIGPDDVKLNIGYDTVRQQSFVTMAMNIDAKGSTIEYKKMVIKNPEKLGKKKNGDNQQQTFSPNSADEGGPERAEVIDVNEAL
jgi:Zn finger protein HypA/HybF involved in hydrogenase expression